ncbi:MAG: hypothetical protein RSD22_06340 [Romboutsia sp.]
MDTNEEVIKALLDQLKMKDKQIEELHRIINKLLEEKNKVTENLNYSEGFWETVKNRKD